MVPVTVRCTMATLIRVKLPDQLYGHNIKSVSLITASQIGDKMISIGTEKVQVQKRKICLKGRDDNA